MNKMSNHPVRAVMIQRAQEMKFGTELTSQGVRFRLWAPESEHVSLRLNEDATSDRPMMKLARGWFEQEEAGAGPGTLYRFVLPDGTCVPDPASRYQPEDVAWSERSRRSARLRMEGRGLARPSLGRGYPL